jgi:hypothetical protein
MKPPVRVFFSSSQGDAEVAERLRRALGSVGIEARTDADIAAGPDWGEHLRMAMESVDAVVILFSPSALSSAYVMSEVGAAIAAEKAVVPVVTTDRGLPSGLPAPLRRWQFVRAGKRDATEVAAEIRERLMQLPPAA